MSKTKSIESILALYPTEGVRKQVGQYLQYRSQLGFSRVTRQKDLHMAEHLADFLAEARPDLEDLLSCEEDTLCRDLKQWMMANDLPLFFWHKPEDTKMPTAVAAPLICFLKAVRLFCIRHSDQPERKKDVWDLEKLDIPVRQNPITIKHRLDFRGIAQKQMREEVKDACHHLLLRESVTTVSHHIIYGKFFSEFLLVHYPEMESFTQVSRDAIEDYLTYLRTECQRAQSYALEIVSVKSLLKEIGELTETDRLVNLFLPTDSSRRPVPLYRTYSDAELSRIHDCIQKMPKQLARLLLIHEYLGTRISETLTLQMDCLYQSGDRWMIRIDQVKTRHTYYKSINDVLLSLLESSMAYTKEHAPTSNWIFPDENEPTRPLQYSHLREQLLKCYRENNLVDDQGLPMRAETHIFRHTYGQRLTELGIEDEVIARLLGHTNAASVKRYRKISDKKMAEELEPVVKYYDQLIRYFMDNYW